MVSTTHTLDDIDRAFDEVWRGDVVRTVVLPKGSPALPQAQDAG
jgi:hypothetical protein